MPKTRAQIASEYKTTVPEQKPGQSDVAYFKQLAKRADQRMVRLERLSTEKGFEGVKSYAYKSAINDIRQLTGNRDATRFNVALQKNKNGEVNKALLHAKINAVKRFLESPTSMKSTIVESYKKRADTLNARYGTNFNWEQMGRFFESALYQKLAKIFGSDIILKIIGRLQHAVNPSAIEESLNQNVRVRDDAVLAEVQKTLDAQQLTLKDFGI